MLQYISNSANLLHKKLNVDTNYFLSDDFENLYCHNLLIGGRISLLLQSCVDRRAAGSSVTLYTGYCGTLRDGQRAGRAEVVVQ